MRAIAIVLLSIASAVTYGIVHDQVTVRICLEYFTIGHPPVFPTESPTLLALGWGILATWWVGLGLGIPLAFVARLGKRPKLGPTDLVRPIAVLLATMAVVAVLAGVAGNIAARAGWVWLVDDKSDRVPEDRHVAYLTDLWAHVASYLAAALGGIVLCVLTWRRRGRLRLEAASTPAVPRTTPDPSTPPA